VRSGPWAAAAQGGVPRDCWASWEDAGSGSSGAGLDCNSAFPPKSPVCSCPMHGTLHRGVQEGTPGSKWADLLGGSGGQVATSVGPCREALPQFP
jgi:hypothetical protein